MAVFHRAKSELSSSLTFSVLRSNGNWSHKSVPVGVKSCCSPAHTSVTIWPFILAFFAQPRGALQEPSQPMGTSPGPWSQPLPNVRTPPTTSCTTRRPTTRGEYANAEPGELRFLIETKIQEEDGADDTVQSQIYSCSHPREHFCLY